MTETHEPNVSLRIYVCVNVLEPLEQEWRVVSVSHTAAQTKKTRSKPERQTTPRKVTI